MTDICERLVRFAGKVCISTDTEVEAAAIIEALRAENAALLAKIVELDTRSRRERCKSTFGYKYDQVVVDEIAARAAMGETE